MQNLKEIYYSSNLDPIPNPDLLFLSAPSFSFALGRKSDAVIKLDDHFCTRPAAEVGEEGNMKMKGSIWDVVMEGRVQISAENIANAELISLDCCTYQRIHFVKYYGSEGPTTAWIPVSAQRPHSPLALHAV